ncbi:cholecystokinin receptor type A [Rhipicephalus sanguineus]|uniref:G-protein coupled receptors family 1 profile domain-containing protein n=1 Tax=Rhipicephalus sanguineus TaxID=34632 RepID=A0A9D4T9M4_RHISA|nr:cholecystokinin receptor type A [Rhipicephalus sanguineus]KAH7983358.1 hypothetical protein HPB52_011399 [Rhipicephalus sanguineus]
MESNCSVDLWEEQLDVFNFSNTSFLDLDELDSTFTWKEYLKMSVYLVTIVAALVGNFAVIVTVVTNRVMRTTINYYLLNLAVADTLICIFCMWVHFVNSLSTFYVLGSFMCRFEGFAKSEHCSTLFLTSFRDEAEQNQNFRAECLAVQERRVQMKDTGVSSDRNSMVFTEVNLTLQE